jgi:hypothetical protein
MLTAPEEEGVLDVALRVALLVSADTRKDQG